VRQGPLLLSVLKEFAADPDDADSKIAATLVKMLEDFMAAMPPAACSQLERLPKNLEDYPKQYSDAYKSFVDSPVFGSVFRPLYKTRRDEVSK